MLILLFLLYSVASDIEAFLSDISVFHVQIEPEMVLHFLSSYLDLFPAGVADLPLR